ncbi:MAG: SIMPL domain-containing protein [Vicinamibacterales bacterium]
MLRRAAALAMVVLALASRGNAQDATPNGSQTPAIVTTGEGIVRRAPDQAFVTIAVETRARTPREAQQQNAQGMTGVQQRLTAAGIPRDAIRTTGYSIQQEFDFTNGRRTPRGYVARNGLEVRVDAVERVGDVLDSTVEGGATTISGVRFDLKDRAGAEREALRLAVVDARARADAIAAGAGRSVDRILRLVDSQQPRFKAPQPMMMERAVASAVPETPIAPGEIEITAQVELTAAIR